MIMHHINLLLFRKYQVQTVQVLGAQKKEHKSRVTWLVQLLFSILKTFCYVIATFSF